MVMMSGKTASALDMAKNFQCHDGKHSTYVESVCDRAEAGLVDPKSQALPPCMLMDRDVHVDSATVD
jgi:hypothetical protein